MMPDTRARSRKLTGGSGVHPDLSFVASLSLRLFPARNRQQPATVNTINTANVIPTPSAILVFFEVDFGGTAVAELVLVDVEDGRDEKAGVDKVGKRELKGTFTGTVIVNDCRPNSAGSSDGM